ncbi:hypothetical protein L1987_82030 [Smallanthus sonchifolius]|uniref:Uncharacterized protein n=1 Tax=Smallanthus sonchifolius TaxID=185202 RepID=A0ACB8YRD3_9ASTR|nr:hypothetical protein L1987_82030 [Smallanthus sonchifolius]
MEKWKNKDEQYHFWWKSFRDLAVPVETNAPPLLESTPESLRCTTTTTTTTSSAGTPRSSWCNSDFTVGLINARFRQAIKDNGYDQKDDFCPEGNSSCHSQRSYAKNLLWILYVFMVVVDYNKKLDYKKVGKNGMRLNDLEQVTRIEMLRRCYNGPGQAKWTSRNK